MRCADRQAHAVTCQRQQLAPVELEDLDAAERPAEALLLEPVEVERHEALAVRGGVVHAAVAGAEHAQGRLGILGDALLVPAADLVERGAADQAHGAAEDDRVAVAARRHGDVEEVAEAVEEPAQVAVVLPVAVVLRGLDERHARVVEVADGLLQPARVHAVVGVDDAEDLHLLGEVLGGLVEGAGLEARPVLEVHEGEARAELLAQLLQRLPHRRVGGVVVDHLDHQVGVVHLGE